MSVAGKQSPWYLHCAGHGKVRSLALIGFRQMPHTETSEAGSESHDANTSLAETEAGRMENAILKFGSTRTGG